MKSRKLHLRISIMMRVNVKEILHNIGSTQKRGLLLTKHHVFFLPSFDLCLSISLEISESKRTLHHKDYPFSIETSSILCHFLRQYIFNQFSVELSNADDHESA